MIGYTHTDDEVSAFIDEPNIGKEPTTGEAIKTYGYRTMIDEDHVLNGEVIRIDGSRIILIPYPRSGFCISGYMVSKDHIFGLSMFLVDHNFIQANDRIVSVDSHEWRNEIAKHESINLPDDDTNFDSLGDSSESEKDPASESTQTYGYQIVTDERGVFFAVVIDAITGRSIIEFHGINCQVFTDGFMVNLTDIAGLMRYLIHRKIIKQHDCLLSVLDSEWNGVIYSPLFSLKDRPEQTRILVMDDDDEAYVNPDSDINEGAIFTDAYGQQWLTLDSNQEEYNTSGCAAGIGGTMAGIIIPLSMIDMETTHSVRIQPIQ